MSPRAVHRGRRGPSSEPVGTQFPLNTSNAILWLCRELLLPWVTPGRSWGRRKCCQPGFLSRWATQTHGAQQHCLRSQGDCISPWRSEVLELQIFGVPHDVVHWHRRTGTHLPQHCWLAGRHKAPPASSPQPGFIFTTSFLTGRCQTSLCIFF